MQLAEQLELQIVSGKLAPGTRLPSVRDFAVQAKVNPNTMQKVLAELEEQRLIFTERTNGKFVTRDSKLIEDRRQIFAQEFAQAYFEKMRQLGFEAADVIKLINQKEDTR